MGKVNVDGGFIGLITNLNPTVGNLDLLPIVFHLPQPFGKNGETRRESLLKYNLYAFIN